MQREEEREMFGLLADQGVGSIPRSPLAKGRLARPWGEQTQRSETDPMAQIALAWVLNNPVVAAPIVGADTCTRSRTCSTSCISLWLGGVIALNVLQVRLGRGRDPVALGSLLCLADLYGRAVIAPVAVVNLLTGLVLIAQMDDVAWSDFWVLWGIAWIVLSVALGATLIRATNAEVRRLAEGAALDNPRWLSRQRRAATQYGINLLVLVSVVWAMVFRRTL